MPTGLAMLGNPLLQQGHFVKIEFFGLWGGDQHFYIWAIVISTSRKWFLVSFVKKFHIILLSCFLSLPVSIASRSVIFTLVQIYLWLWSGLQEDGFSVLVISCDVPTESSPKVIILRTAYKDREKDLARWEKQTESKRGVMTLWSDFPECHC